MSASSPSLFLPQHAYLSRTPPREIRANQSRFRRDYLPHRTPIKPHELFPESLFPARALFTSPSRRSRRVWISPEVPSATTPPGRPCSSSARIVYLGEFGVSSSSAWGNSFASLCSLSRKRGSPASLAAAAMARRRVGHCSGWPAACCPLEEFWTVRFEIKRLD